MHRPWFWPLAGIVTVVVVACATTALLAPRDRPLTPQEFDAEWARASEDLDGEERAAAPGAVLTPDPRLYPAVDLAKLAGRDGWVRPRALAVGVVKYAKPEADGDFHFVLTDGTVSVVCEIVPELPLPRPKVGQRVAAWGVARWDGEHKWGELHPVVGWRPQQ